MTDEGARRLSFIYWQEVRRSTAGLVRVHDRRGGPALRILGAGPALLRFGPPQLTVGEGGARCAHSIDGGLLCRRPGGSIWFEQRTEGAGARLTSGIAGFHPRLAAQPGAPAWTGELYKRVQSRLHVAVARRYFARLVREAGR
ncbi:MAG TPA: hypothetical protein VFQ71_07165 [Gaiellales bacterium]|nr:hypothetical protein [Gaiellales bacterium]